MTDENIQKEYQIPESVSSLGAEPQKSTSGSGKKFLIIGIIVILVVATLVTLAAIFLVKPENSQTTEQIRDVFLIFMALESMLIGIALIVLIIQLATLINLLQNEIRPIIDSTNETVNTLKGTVTFLSNNLSEPVIKMNQVFAMIKQLIGPRKR